MMTVEDPENGSVEWKTIQTGKQLSKWMDEWLQVLAGFESVALDLANQECPYERILKYW